jgi:ABC-type sugar transport system substrate-binding protein
MFSKAGKIAVVVLLVVSVLLSSVQVAFSVVAMKQQTTVVMPEIVVATEVPKPEREGIFYFLAANNSDPFYIPGVKGLTDAGMAVGMKTEFVGPMEASTTEQMKTFEELIASPLTKGIFWYAMDFNVGQPLVEAAMAKGIPVVIGAADSPFKTRNAFVGYNNTVLGIQAAQWANNLIGCKGTVGTIAINGVNLDERTAAFNAYFKANCPDVKVIERVTHDGSAASEAVVLEAYLVAHPDLTLLWWADGAAGNQAQIWKEKLAQGVKILFLATDMPPATLQAVKDGIFVGSVGQDTYTEAYISIIMLDLLSKGFRVPDTMFLSAILVDKNNVDLYLNK